MEDKILNSSQNDFLRKVSSRYVWWNTTDEALLFPHLLVAKIMNNGTLEDVKDLLTVFSDDYLIDILKNAEVGQFTPQSWAFWNYRLLKCAYDHVPPLPVRFIE